MHRRFASPVLALLLSPLAGGALAVETPWADLGPVLRARLVTGDAPAADGTLTIGLELDIAPGARTYWVRAGEAGIGTSLDASASTGVTVKDILWPLPEVLIEAGLMEYVYRGDVVIPLAITLTGPGPELRLGFAGGVCTDICMPVSGTLALPLAGLAADAGGRSRLDLAMAQVPILWTEPTPPFTLVDCGPDGVTLAGVDRRIAPQSLILEEKGSDALYLPDPGTGHFSRIAHAAPGDNPSFRVMFSSTLGPFVVETRCPSTAAGG